MFIMDPGRYSLSFYALLRDRKLRLTDGNSITFVSTIGALGWDLVLVVQ